MWPRATQTAGTEFLQNLSAIMNLEKPQHQQGQNQQLD